MRKRLIAILNRFIERQNQKLGVTQDGGGVHSAQALHRSTVSAVVTRADGTVEDLGVITTGLATNNGVKTLNEDTK